MEKTNYLRTQSSERRRRLHELVIALIGQQQELELVDAEAPSFDGRSSCFKTTEDPALWLERNRRILQNYQSLVRSAITLDDLIDSEQFETGRNTEH